MAAPDIETIKTRLTDLLILVPDTNGVIEPPDIDKNNSDCKPDSTLLPLFVAPQDRDVQFSQTSADSLSATQSYEMLLLVQEICDDDPASKRAALAAVTPFLFAVPLFFARRRRLELNDGGIVYGTELMAAGGRRIATFAGGLYSAALFALPVITRLKK